MTDGLLRVESLSKSFGGFAALTNVSIQRVVEECPNLTWLDLRCCPKFTDEALQHVSTLKNLRTLNLWGSEFTDVGIQHLLQLKNLSSLLVNNGVTDVSLQILAPTYLPWLL